MAEGSGFAIRVSSYQSPLYLPQYVGVAAGLFAADSLDVDLVPSPGPWPDVIAAVREDRADILVGNIWFGLRSEADHDPLISFAYGAQQCRYVVLRRTGVSGDGFEWSELSDTTVLFPTDVATPWVAFCEIMSSAGVALSSMRLILGFGPQETLDEFARGIGDFLICAAERVPSELEPCVVASFAETLGPVPWCVYCAPRSMLDKHRSELAAFTRAIGESERWIGEHSDREITDTVASLLPNIAADDLERTIGRYRQISLWPTTSDIPKDHCERWHNALVRWGLLGKAVSLEDMVVNLGTPEARAEAK